jgi:hypothetical protein
MAERFVRSRLNWSAAMSLYFFDMLSTDGLAPDEEGMELSTMDDVQNEAAYALADMLRDDVRATIGNPTARELIIVVRDGSGPVLQARYSFEVMRLQ